MFNNDFIYDICVIQLFFLIVCMKNYGIKITRLETLNIGDLRVSIVSDVIFQWFNFCVERKKHFFLKFGQKVVFFSVEIRCFAKIS